MSIRIAAWRRDAGGPRDRFVQPSPRNGGKSLDSENPRYVPHGGRLVQKIGIVEHDESKFDKRDIGGRVSRENQGEPCVAVSGGRRPDASEA